MGVVDLAVMTTRADPIQLTTQLMSIDSTSGREGDVIAWLDSRLAAMGWRTRLGFLVVALITLLGVLRSGAAYFYCPMMGMSSAPLPVS